jgi:tetrahydromethanopterin S-methyltransferase subunit G
MADVEISNRRRIVLDWGLATSVVLCILAFADLRATVHAQTTQFERVVSRLDAVEQREQTGAGSVATKADIQRLEARLDKLVEAVLDANPPRR